MIKSFEYYENIDIKDYTTFKISCKVKCLIFPKTITQLKKIIIYSKINNVKYFILGNGSNILPCCDFFNGIIIHLKNFNKIKIKKDIKKVKIIAQSGVKLLNLNSILAKNNIAGFEWSYGIPATVGGAVKMNAGAYGEFIGNFVKEIKILENNKIKKIKNPKFYYRKSPIKNQIILSATLTLHHGNKILILEKMQSFMKKRLHSQPYTQYSAGSVFKRGKKNKLNIKNINKIFQINNKKILNNLKFNKNKNKKNTKIIKFNKNKITLIKKYTKNLFFCKNQTFFYQFYPAKIIEELNLKGLCIGDAQISTKHAGFIINKKNATSNDVLSLISVIKDRVKKEGFNFEEEIIFLNN